MLELAGELDSLHALAMLRIGTGCARLAVSAGLLVACPRPAIGAELMARGPAECADAAELSFRVERRVGVPLASAAPLKFEVELERAASGYAARIGMVGASGTAAKERRLAAKDCEQLVEAVSMAVALALGADGAPPSQPARGESAAPAPPLASAEIQAPEAPRSSPGDAGTTPGAERAASAWTPSLSAWLLGDAGSLPRPSLGAALGAELSFRGLELRALGTLFFEQHTEVESPLSPPPGADLRLWAASLLACSTASGNLLANVSTLACLGVELGQLTGVGTDVAGARRGSALWLGPRLDVGALWSIPDSPLRLGATFTAVAPLNRDRFELTDIGAVHQPPYLVGRLSLGFGVRFK